MTHDSVNIGIRHHLSRRLLPLAVSVGLLISVLAPVTYWKIEHANLRHVAVLYAQDMAGHLVELVRETPGLWQYQSYKFMNITRGLRFDVDLDGFGVLDEKGEAISGYASNDAWKKYGRKLTFREDLDHTLGAAPLLFNNRRIGTVEVLVSDARLRLNTLILFGISILVGTTLGGLIYLFPTRVVRGLELSLKELFGKLQQSEQGYRSLNAELELKVEERTRQLLDAQEELVRKEKLSILGQLSGSVGHELRNPLGVMSNAVYFLKMVLTAADDTTKEYLDIIKQEIDNSQRIITDLLDFARTKSPQIRTVTVHELVEANLGRCALPESVQVVRELPDMLPMVSVDPLQIGQVLQNLFMNAVQAMAAEGELRIRARQLRVNRDGEQGTGGEGNDLDLRTPNLEFCEEFVEFSVADTGEGISPENMRKLFQPLFTTKAKGIGLGLVVCRNLVEANGGRITVESELGKGTTFVVILPVERGAAWGTN